MADPGFPRGGGANPPGSRQHMILPKFPKNLHEIEIIWTPKGGCASKILLCRSATDIVLIKFWQCYVIVKAGSAILSTK